MHSLLSILFVGDDRRELLWGNFGMEMESYGPTLIHDEVMSFIETHKDKPFYCFYALIQPHAEMLLRVWRNIGVISSRELVCGYG